MFRNEKENSSVIYEQSLYSAVRLFTKSRYLDSLTIAHKFVEDVKYLFECFTIISKGNCFLSIPTAKLYPKQNRNQNESSSQCRQRNHSISVFQCFPQWFTPSKGGTIYEWLCAFFEYTLLSKYEFLSILY